MKSFLAISLTLVYLLGIIGVQVNFHYCMGEVEDIALFTEAEKCICGNESINTLYESVSNNCCSDTSIDVQINDDQNTSSNLSLSVLKLIGVCQIVTVFAKTDEEIHDDFYFISSNFPSTKEPLWLLHHSLLYYS